MSKKTASLFSNKGLRFDAHKIIREEMYEKGIMKRKGLITDEVFQIASEYIINNRDRVNRIAEERNSVKTNILEVSKGLVKDIELLNGTMIEIERLISFKIGSIDAREHLMKLVQGLMVTSIAVGIDSVHEKADRIIVDNITKNYGVRGS